MFRTQQKQILTSQSMTGSFQSEAEEIRTNWSISMQVVWSGGGAPVGTADIQESNDGTNWHNIAGATNAISGNSGAVMLKPTRTDIAARYIRFSYTVTSGTASANVFMSTKGN